MKRTYAAFLLSFAVLAGPAFAAHGGGHGQGGAGRVQARVERQARQSAHANARQPRTAHRQVAAQRQVARAERHQVRTQRYVVRAERQVMRAQRHQVRAQRNVARVEHRAAAVARHSARAERHLTARTERRAAAVARQSARVERRQSSLMNRLRHEQRIVGQQRAAQQVRAAEREARGVFDRWPLTLRQERVRARAEQRQAMVEQGRLAREERRALRQDRFIAGEQRRQAVFAQERFARRQQVLRPARFAGQRRFRGLDVNGDGVVERVEWRGNDRSFSNHDWNGDGILDGNEVVPAGRRVARVERFSFLERFMPLPQRFVAPVPLVVASTAVPVFDIAPLPPLAEVLPLPVNEARWETVFRTQGFAPIDVVVNRVQVSPVDRVLIDDRFACLDVNHDRFVGFDEWMGPRPVFRTLDLNRDRLLAPSELVVSRPIVRTVSLIDRDRYVAFQLLDVNDNGVVEPWEWTGDMDTFFLLDYDGNGLVNESEYLGMVRTRPVPVRLVANGALDLDHNGYISRYEWVGDPYRFVSLDLNGDGRVKPAEAVAGALLATI